MCTRIRYYWPTLRKSYSNFVKRCLQCQKHGNLIHWPTEELHPIIFPWPFAIWGMDILGTFSKALGKKQFLLVVIDYFIKWVKAEPLETITTQNVPRLIWKNIITFFSILCVIVTDNGLQFIDRKLNEFMAGLNIKNMATSIEHPQANGQAKAANKVIIVKLKK